MSAIARRSFLAAGGLALAGCTATGALDVLVPRGTYRSEESIAYGALARQRLDVYLPTNPATDAPLVVFFYGGSWSHGRRQDYRFVGESLASAGIVTVIPDYRLSPEVGWQDILRDCAAATQWAHAQAARLGASPQRFFVSGHSAGAYNAAMLALDDRWLGAHALRPDALAGWAGIAGPYDFLPISDPQSQRAFGWPATPVDSQPVAHVSAAAPRTLLLAAHHDSVVDPQRNTLGLAQRLERARVPVRVQVFDGVSHVTIIGALATPLRQLAPVRDELLRFVGA